MPVEVVRYSGFEQYTSLPAQPTLRPYLPVRLQAGGRYQDTVALVDSGADGSLFNAEWAAALGLTLDPAKRQPIGGIGSGWAWYFDIFLTVKGKRLPASVAFTYEKDRTFGLLGRRDFFTAFQLGFDEPKQRLLYSKI